MTKMFKVHLAAGVVGWVVMTAGGAIAEQIRVTYSSWCPHVCTDENEILLEDAPGFATELVRDALTEQGYDVLFTPQPFARQLQDVISGEQYAVLHIKKAPDRDYVWPSVSTGVDQQCFVVNKSSTWTYDGIASLDEISIGAISGFKYGVLSDYMDDPNNKVEFLSGDRTDLRNLEKVALGRIDAFLDNSVTNAYLMQQNGLSDQLKFAGCLEPIDLFLAFSTALDTSTEHAAALDRGLTSLRADGRFETILQKYGLIDWLAGS